LYFTYASGLKVERSKRKGFEIAREIERQKEIEVSKKESNKRKENEVKMRKSIKRLLLFPTCN